MLTLTAAFASVLNATVPMWTALIAAVYLRERVRATQWIGLAVGAAGIVVLVGDLSESTMVHIFAERFPERFIQVGIAEQNMMCVAAGLAAMGKIPFLATYGAFASCRSADQMRVTVAYSNLNVKTFLSISDQN